MTDSLREREEAARLALYDRESPHEFEASREHSNDLDAYRDAIEARVRAERGVADGLDAGGREQGARDDEALRVARAEGYATGFHEGALKGYPDDALRWVHDEALREALGQLLAAWEVMEDTGRLDGEVREDAERIWQQALSIARAIYSLGAADEDEFWERTYQRHNAVTEYDQRMARVEVEALIAYRERRLVEALTAFIPTCSYGYPGPYECDNPARWEAGDFDGSHWSVCDEHTSEPPRSVAAPEWTLNERVDAALRALSERSEG